MTKKKAVDFINFLNICISPLAIMLLWNWFMTEVNLPRIDYLTSFGISLLITLLTWNGSSTNKLAYEDSEEARYYQLVVAGTGLAYTILAILIGFIIHYLETGV